MLIDDIWVVQLFLIVTLTAFSLYFIYLFPINYFDLLYRCSVHLGHWELIQPAAQQTNISYPQLQQHQRVGIVRIQNEQQQPNEHFEMYDKYIEQLLENKIIILEEHNLIKTERDWCIRMNFISRGAIPIIAQFVQNRAIDCTLNSMYEIDLIILGKDCSRG